MARHPRLVYPGIPHHVTQRGNRRETIFFDDANRRVYLLWLADYCAKHKVEVAAYCLMPNHVHIVAVPESADGLERVFRPLHTRYVQYINRHRDWSGHLLQGRYFSSALDPAHFVAAVRYVERNPVRALAVRRAEDYPWSSAAAHCGLRADPALSRIDLESHGLPSKDAWSAWLAETDAACALDVLRHNNGANLPCGDMAFIHDLAAEAGRDLLRRRPGRPRNAG